MKDYPYMYSKRYVLLITEMCLKNLEVNTQGAPASSWNAMLSMVKVELDLISDVDMYLFFEKIMRGGVSYISKRQRKVNNA